MQCNCLEYIGDNPPCPVHGDPYGHLREPAARPVVTLPILRTLDDQLIQKIAITRKAQANTLPDLSQGE